MTLGSDRLARLRGFAVREGEAFLARARTHRALWPAAAIVAVTAVAYNLTFASMFDYLRLETPLAYLPLLPLFSIGIALFTAHRYRNAPPSVRDRQVDLLLGIPMIVLAMVLITVVPALASTYYWSNRPDVLSMTLFVAGLITIFYGVSWLWRLKAALLFLLLMWPSLYLNVMPGIMQSFTDATNGALAQVVHHLPLAVTLTDTPGLLVVQQASGSPITVSVGSACSGADSVLGFLLIGAAILTTVRGPRGRKLLWMALGLALTFIFNVLRLTSILALAGAGHPALALGGYHAVIGLVLFTVVILVMMRLLRTVGLRPREDIVVSDGRRRGGTAAAARLVSVRRRRIVIGVMVGLAVAVGLTDHALGPYAAFQDGTGSPRVLPFSEHSAPDGFAVTHEADYPWATQYFGTNSTYSRYLVVGAPKAGAGAVTTSATSSIVYADVVRTDDKGALDAYNLQNCFLFHNYSIVTSEKIDVGSGVTALLLNYSDPSTKARWATVSWAWPVENKGTTYFERIALTSSLQVSGGDSDVSPNGGLNSLLVGLLNLLNGSHDDAATQATFKNADAALRAEAARLVDHAVNQPG